MKEKGRPDIGRLICDFRLLQILWAHPSSVRHGAAV